MDNDKRFKLSLNVKLLWEAFDHFCDYVLPTVVCRLFDGLGLMCGCASLSCCSIQAVDCTFPHRGWVMGEVLVYR